MLKTCGESPPPITTWQWGWKWGARSCRVQAHSGIKMGVPISWMMVPFPQQPLANDNCCLRPVLPTYDQHLWTRCGISDISKLTNIHCRINDKFIRKTMLLPRSFEHGHIGGLIRSSLELDASCPTPVIHGKLDLLLGCRIVWEKKHTLSLRYHVYTVYQKRKENDSHSLFVPIHVRVRLLVAT